MFENNDDDFLEENLEQITKEEYKRFNDELRQIFYEEFLGSSDFRDEFITNTKIPYIIRLKILDDLIGWLELDEKYEECSFIVKYKNILLDSEETEDI